MADKDIPTWRQADIPIPLQRQAGPSFSQRQAVILIFIKVSLSYSFSSRGRLTQLVLEAGFNYFTQLMVRLIRRFG